MHHVRLRPCRVSSPMFTYDRCMTRCHDTPTLRRRHVRDMADPCGVRLVPAWCTMPHTYSICQGSVQVACVRLRTGIRLGFTGYVLLRVTGDTFTSVDGIRVPNCIDISEPLAGVIRVPNCIDITVLRSYITTPSHAHPWTDALCLRCYLTSHRRLFSCNCTASG